MITLKDVLIGGIAGVAGTMAMPVVTKFMYKYESKEKKELEEKLRPEPPFKVMTKKIVNGVNAHPSKKTMKMLSMGMHWGYGIAWGALYGVLRKKYPALSKFGGAQKARLYFEKMLGYANHVGLYAEQLGPCAEHLGNFPQAFTHLGLISTARVLNSRLDEEMNKGNKHI